MKQLVTTIVLTALLIGCNNNTNSNSNSTSTKDTAASPQAKNISRLIPILAHLDNNVSAHVKNIFDHYFHVKTALVNSNPDEAKKGANAILRVLKDFDRSLLPADQKAVYDKPVRNVSAAATGIIATNEIETQREHFATLSNNAYELAKSFGGGKTLYHNHCPMAFNNKGAMWLSEIKEVKNPYYGEKMLTCGTIEEVIEN